MRIGDFLRDAGRIVAYYPRLVKITGSVEANVLLCQFCYWEDKQKDSEGWIYKTQQEIEEETGITPNSQRTARENLKKRGLIQERFKGIPRKLEFRIEHDALDQRWQYFLTYGEEPKTKEDKRKNNTPSEKCRKSRSLLIDRKDQSIAEEKIEILFSEKSTASRGKDQQQAEGKIDLYQYMEITSKITSESAAEESSLSLSQDPDWNSLAQQTESWEAQQISLASLLNKPEILDEAEEPFRGSKEGVRSFDEPEQLNNYHIESSAEKCDRRLSQGLPPWRNKTGANGLKDEFIEKYKKYLSSTPHYIEKLKREATIAEAKESLRRKEKESLQSVWNIWDTIQELEQKELEQKQEQQKRSLVPDNIAPPPPVAPSAPLVSKESIESFRSRIASNK